MNFFDVIRHLVHNGPFETDAHRQAALDAVDEHEAATVPAPAGSPADEEPEHPGGV